MLVIDGSEDDRKTKDKFKEVRLLANSVNRQRMQCLSLMETMKITGKQKTSSEK
jgi:hypothetical protein